MKISKKADYALRALVFLVEQSETGQPVPLSQISKIQEIPRKFLEHIMLDLKEQGWIRSVPGRKGGYRLSIDPERITLGQVVRCFDGVLAPIGCVSIHHHESCSLEGNCRFRRVFLQIRNEVARIMDHATLASVARMEAVSNVEVYNLEFNQGEGI